MAQKKIILILSILLSFWVFNINEVKADNNTISYDYYIEKDNHDKPGITFNGNIYEVYQYTANSESQRYQAYCLDPALSRQAFYKINANYYDDYSKNRADDYSRGIINIMQAANDKGLLNNYSDLYNYTAVQLAVRAWKYETGHQTHLEIYYPDGKWYHDFFERDGNNNFSSYLKEEYTNVSYNNEKAKKAMENAKSIFNVAVDWMSNSPYKKDDVREYTDGIWEFGYNISTNETFNIGKKVTDSNLTGQYSDLKTNIGLIKNDKNGYYYSAQIKVNTQTAEIEGVDIPEGVEFATSYVDDASDGTRVFTVELKSNGTWASVNQDFSYKIKYNDWREASNYWNLIPANNDNMYQSMLMIEPKEISKTITVNIENKPTETNEKNYCQIKISNQTCSDDGSTTFSVGYIDENGNLNEDCLYGEKNINKDLLDNEDNTKSNKLTYDKNEYCSLTCAEKIDFTLPSKVGAVTAGQYWEWKKEDIKVTGTRKCQATVNVDGFEKDVTSKLSDDIKERISNIYDKDKSKIKTNTTGNYGLTQQLEDLKKAYDDYMGISDSVSTSEKTCSKTHHRTCSDGISDCSYTGYSTKYTYISPITGETFERYEKGDGSCATTNDYQNSSKKTPTKIATEVFENTFNNISKSVKSKVDEVNSCTDSLNTKTSKDTYNFDPQVAFAYDDSKYNTMFGSNTSSSSLSNIFNSTQVNEESKLTENITGKDKQVSYLTEITSNNTTNLPYYSNKKNNFVNTKIKYYSSSVYFYLNYSTFNMGILDSKVAGNDNITSTINSIKNANNYYLGNVFPVSLNEQKGSKKYFLYFQNLGVNNNGTSSNRFNKMGLNGKALEYACSYNVLKDITTDDGENSDKPNFYYRNISLNNVNPNKRELGKNWTNEKAKATLCEIAGGKYNNGDCTSQANTSPESTYETPEYSFTLTPENMQAIKKYNQEKEKDSNGYADFNMTAVNSDGTTNTGDNKLWFKSNFIWDSKTCQNCFTSKNEGSKTTFTAWSDNVEKLSGTGPAWK